MIHLKTQLPAVLTPSPYWTPRSRSPLLHLHLLVVLRRQRLALHFSRGNELDILAALDREEIFRRLGR